MKYILPEKLLDAVKSEFSTKHPAIRFSNSELSRKLKSFVNSVEMRGINPEFGKLFQDESGLDVKTVRVAFLRDSHKDSGAEEKMRNLLCYYAFKIDWKTALSQEFNTTEEEIEKFTLDLKQQTKSPEVKEQVVLKQANYELITPEVFEKERSISSQALNNLTLNYYTRFNNIPQNLKSIIANDRYALPEVYQKFQLLDDELQNINIEEIVGSAIPKNPILIKILGVGGEGKSTLLWHYIKLFCSRYKTFFLKTLNPQPIVEVLNLPNLLRSEPVIFFLDDITSTEENKNLISIGELIADNCTQRPIIFIGAERYYRYTRSYDAKKFENFFTHSYVLLYSSHDLRSQIFDKIYSYLTSDTDPIQKNHHYTYFTQNNSLGLIDSIFFLILEIKAKIGAIDYRFDWEDWEDSCINQYEILNSLYKFVAFFYQFGIPTPLNAIANYYKNSDTKSLVRELLRSNETFSPIIISHRQNNEFLSLRHEKMGEWYFKIIPNGLYTAKDFFDEFIQNVRTREYSYLFRNIIRHNTEFELSTYRKYISNEIILKIINQYLSGIDEKDYSEEEYKVLMEKHFVLSGMEKDNNERIAPLEISIKLDPKNIFAKTRLAVIKMSDDPLRAKLLCKEVLDENSNSHHARSILYRLLIKNPRSSEFNTFEQECFDYAKNNPSFANSLFTIIKDNEHITPSSTIIELTKLYKNDESLASNVLDVLIKLKRFKEAQELIINIAIIKNNLDNQELIRFLKNMIRYCMVSGDSDKQVLNASFSTLRSLKNKIGENSDLLYLEAKLYQLNYSSHNHKRAESLITKAYELNPNKFMFFTVMNFYVSYFKAQRDRLDIQTPHLASTLNRGINFSKYHNIDSKNLDSRLNLVIANLYNLLSDTYYKHFCITTFNKGEKYDSKYPFKITALVNQSETILVNCINNLGSELRKLDDLPYSYRFDLLRNQYSKACSLLYELYKKTIFHYKRIEISGFDYKTKFPALKKYSEYSLIIDKENPYNILTFIELKITLNESDYNSLLKQALFHLFSTYQKAKLCSILIKKGDKEAGLSLFKKFGKLNSNDLRVKNNLAFCYMEAKNWELACESLSGLSYKNYTSRNLINNLMELMPINTIPRVKAKYNVLMEYEEDANMSFIYKIKFKESIFACLFSLGKKNELERFYVKNIKYFRIQQSNIELGEKCKAYYLHRLIIIEVSVKSRIRASFNDYDKSLIELINILKYLKEIFALDIQFENVNYNFNTEEEYIHLTNIIKLASEFLQSCIDAYPIHSNLHFNQIKQFDSFKLFRQIFLYRLNQFTNNTHHSFIPILKHYLKMSLNENDCDSIRLIGQIYQKLENFEKASFLLKVSLDLSQSKEQKSYAYLALADQILGHIENNITSGKGNNLKKVFLRIDSAQEYLLESMRLHSFAYQASVKQKLNDVVAKYKI